MATPCPALELPKYALDGRTLSWNADGTGVMFDSTDDEYHSDNDAASSSALKLMDRSPAHLIAERLRRTQMSASGNTAAKKHFVFGTAVHSAVLEPRAFKQTYIAYPGPENNSTSRTKAYRDFEQANPNKRILMPSKMAEVEGCARSILSTSVIRTDTQSFTMADLVDIGTTERNFYWVDLETGVTCKARMDLTIENLVLDVKTAPDARRERFMYDAAKFGYHIQAAFYMDGYARCMPENSNIIMTFLVAERTSPHGAVVYQADKDTFWGFGRKRVRELLVQYRKCMQTRHWPAYAEGPQLLKLPMSKLYQAPRYDFNY